MTDRPFAHARTHASAILLLAVLLGHSALVQADQLHWEVAVESRQFYEAAPFEQDRNSYSASLEFEWYHAWDGGRQSVTAKPFYRLDSADSRRSHGDFRELFYSVVGNGWDVHVGARKVFWGVTEFNHLVDIVNQTDLIENIDGEDKLGQPMVQWSLVRDWGLLDVYALVGFRERSYAGLDGRVRLPVEVLDDARFESGAENKRVDAAIRWQGNIGPAEVGVHHFSGTSREPLLEAVVSGGQVALLPYYPVIDQTGVDAQALLGDWALKLEGFARSGFDNRYHAVNLGLEKTFFAVGGSLMDVGLVLEYMYDERQQEAFNTLFENDWVVGGRFQFNNYADTTLLVGYIRDARSSEYLFSVEGSHRLSDVWQLNMEMRGFGGSPRINAQTTVEQLLSPDYKASWLRSEDYVQLELRRFF